MIKFKNINGDVFLAVGSVKRKSALNGEKSLSATITQGDDVLNKIDKGWSLEFDNEPYVVTYFERNDNDNTVEIDAIHKFFWDMTKSVLYATYSSSHVARFYLDEIFKDTGYTYALNFDPKAFEKENWGMKNKLSLFNDIISSIGAEFEINGTLISIFKNVGSDLSTIVRHGFNLSDMTLENDNANFATYAEGFGAYEDQENQKGPRLHVTYKSSLAKAFGKLHAEPVDDQRYTVKDNLLQAVKDKVDGSFAVSVKLSLYDLTAAGYPYKMANVGDWLLAVDENLDFKQKIRIISVDDEFAEDGTRISYTVTCGDVGVAKKYQDANASLSQKVQSAYDNAQAAKESAIQAVISSTGKNTNYWFDSVDEMNAFQGNEGDLAFVQIGDGQAMYVYTKMPDGSFKWVKRLDPDTGEQIAAGVEEAISTANKYTDELNEKQASEAAAFQSEANVALSSAAAERADMFKQSTSMATSAATHADSMANSAAAYGKAQAASALSNANAELASAKKELGSEVSKAQSDIIVAQNELAGKVSQTDYDTKTGDLTKKYGQVKATADAVTTDVAKYETANDKKVSANTASINTLNNQITSKVSQTDFDKKTGDLSGKYTETKQTVDSMSQIVTELQAKANAQGQVNQLLNTEFTPDLQGWDVSVTNSSDRLPYQSYVSAGSNLIAFDTRNNAENSRSVLSQGVPIGRTSATGRVASISWYSRFQENNNYGNVHVYTLDSNHNNLTDEYKSFDNTHTNEWSTGKFENIEIPDEARYIQIMFIVREGVYVFLGKPMLVFEKTVGEYTPGNYNNNNRVAALELGIDHITGLVNDPKNGLSAIATLAANGLSVATKAQSDATTAIQTAQGTQTTVTSVQKDVKDLQSTTTQTAGQVTTEIEDRKNGDSTTRTHLTNLIDQRVTSVEKGYESYFDQKADGILLGVGTPNMLVNSDFNPDLSGWSVDNFLGGKKPYRSYFDKTANKITVGFNTQSDNASMASLSQTVALASTPGARGTISLSWQARTTSESAGTQTVSMSFVDSSGNTIGKSITADWSDKGNGWNIKKIEGIDIPDKATSLTIAFVASEKVTAYLTKPMLSFTNKAMPYMPGSATNSSTVLQLFKDNWSIGLADNLGKITSGIVADNDNMALINKNITLQGNTTVTADFYAKGGNFKNLNASNITTGTINAAKINVINLDVSNLSGNITNFIKSYWNTAFSQLKITADELDFTARDSRLNMNRGRLTLYNNADGYYRLGGLGTLVDTNIFGQSNHNAGISLYLDEWHTTKKNDKYWNYGGPEFFGGSEIGFLHSDGVDENGPTYSYLMKWANNLSASRDKSGTYKGFNFYDQTTFWNPIFGPQGEQLKFGKLNGVQAISLGGKRAGIAGNDTDLYLFNSRGYISLSDLMFAADVSNIHNYNLTNGY